MTTTYSAEQDYIPALSQAWLTPLYDNAMATIFQEWRYRSPLVSAVSQAVAGQPGAVIVEVGSGTATVSLLIQSAAPEAVVVSTDIDPAMLARASVKAAQSPLVICGASATLLPMDDASADAVVSSLMFHHLTTAQKQSMLAECLRVLRPGGSLFLLDFGPPQSPTMAETVRTLLGRFEHLDVNLSGGIPPMLADAGFADIVADGVAFGGLIQLFCARRP